jgi:hypothetical protein
MPFGLGDALSADQVMAIIQRNPVLAEVYQVARSAGIARAYEIAQREPLPVGVTEGEYSETPHRDTATDTE